MLSTLQKAIGRRSVVSLVGQIRALSFRPRRRMDDSYRPLTPRSTKRASGPLPEDHFPDPFKTVTDIGEYESEDILERNYGPLAADAIKLYIHEKKELEVEDQLRFADFLTTENGTTEALVLKRRALAWGSWDEQDRKSFEKQLDEIIEEEKVNMMGLGHLDDDDEPEPKKDGTEKIESNEAEEEMEEEDEYDKFGKLIDKDPTILAHGAWYVVLFSQSRPCTASMPAVFLYSIITQVGASCPN